MKIKTLVAAFLLISLNVFSQTKLSIVFIGNSITQGKGGDNGFPPPTKDVKVRTGGEVKFLGSYSINITG